MIRFPLVVVFALSFLAPSQRSYTQGSDLLQSRSVNISNHDSSFEDADLLILGAGDPKSAVLQIMQKKKEYGTKGIFPYFLAREWYRRDQKGFLEWARTLNKSDFAEANMCLTDVVENLDSAEAESYVLNEMARGQKRNTAIFTLGFNKASKDPSKASEWAERLPADDPGRLPAIDSVAIAWSRKDPVSAVKWIHTLSETLPYASDNSNNKNVSVAVWICNQSLFKKSPELALEWALKNPNNQSRNVECYRLIRKWAKLDKNSPRFFIGKVEDHTLRSPLLLGYLSEAKDFDTGDYPEIADWMITIEGTPFIAKEGSFFPLFLSTWFDKDIPGGLNWIQKQKTSNENEAIFKGNVVASLLVGENPFTSGRFNKNTEPISATDSSQNIPSQLSSSQSEDVNPWFTNITEQKIRGDYAVIIWKAFLGALVLFGVWKTWVVLKTRDIPVPIKGALVFLNLFIFLSIIAGTDEAIISKHSILTQTTVLEASAGCFGILFIFSYYFLFSNQCAAGSRAMPIFGASLTILGIAGIVVAVFFKGDFAASIGVLVLGAIPLLASLPKRSRDFRKFSREKRKTVPRFLLISGAIVLGVFVFAVGGDVIKNIQQNPKFALQLALISPFGMAFYLGPIYWSLRWGDALGLRLYQFALLLVACFSAFCGFGFLKSGNPFSKSYLFFIGFLVFFIPFLLTFHRSVRKWSKELRPIF